METKYRSEKSINGLCLDVIKSGLQKSIRRGHAEQALYYGREFYSFNEAGEGGKRIVTNFRHRLMIISLEDVCNMQLIPQVEKSLKEPLDSKLVVKLILNLCNSTKSRICSHVRAIFNEENKRPELLAQFPQIAEFWERIDLINYSSLEQQCRWFKHFLGEGDVVCVFFAFQIAASKEKLPRRYCGRTKPVWYIFEHLSGETNWNELTKLYKDELQNTKEGFLCWLVLLLHRLRIIPDGAFDDNLIDKTIVDWPTKNMEIEDYILDKHTRFGRGSTDFATVGAFVENEATFTNSEWKRFYEMSKSSCGENETAKFKFIIRTQLTTSAHKMDVYFAQMGEKFVVVKGPFANPDGPNLAIKFANWKKEFGLPFIPVENAQLVPDRWPEGVPLGARNHISRAKLANFLIFDSQILPVQIISKTHSSKLWPPTEVVDWSKVALHFDIALASQIEMIDYVHALLFRFVFGISDLADRNFLRVNGRVVSIDEDVEMRPVDFFKELKKMRAAIIFEWIKQNYSKLLIDSWRVPPKFNEQLAIIQNFSTCCSLFCAPSARAITENCV